MRDRARLLAAMLVLAGPPANAQHLTFVEAHFDGVDGVDGLGGGTAVTVSPDGWHVYAAGGFDSALAVFARDPASGALTFVEALFDGAPGNDGLRGVSAVKVSPDGAHVYTAASGEDKIGVFSRNPVSGRLTLVEAPSQPPLIGLGGVLSVALDPAGESLYSAAFADDAAAAFVRQVDGRLSFVEAEFDGLGGVEGLDGARGVTVSPDGAHVYVAGAIGDSVAVFARTPATGALEFVEARFDDVDGVQGLDAAADVVASPDGAHLYAAGQPDFTGDDWLVVFEREAATGSLGFVEAVLSPGIEGFPGCPLGPSDPKATITPSPSGTFLYATNAPVNALVVFRRDLVSGGLTGIDSRCEGLGGVVGMETPSAVAASPDGHHLYVATFFGNSLAVFRVNEIFSDGFESGDTAAWAGSPL